MNAAPPKIVRANARFTALILVAMLAGLAVIVFLFNPATHAFYPVCQFHRLTGLNCPGCGMTRALHALMHGEFLQALRDNALLVFAVAAVVLRGGWHGWNQFAGRPNGEFFPVTFLWPLLVVAVIFTVLRNLPAFSFLSP